MFYVSGLSDWHQECLVIHLAPQKVFISVPFGCVRILFSGTKNKRLTHPKGTGFNSLIEFQKERKITVFGANWITVPSLGQTYFFVYVIKSKQGCYYNG